MFGIGATIGTGIFIVLTQAVPVAGPAVIWSFVIAGMVAGLTAICYAELASAVPVSGSSYSYAYATLGEGVAIIVAACLLLEYGVAAGGGRRRLVAVPQRAARQPVRLHDPREPVAARPSRADRSTCPAVVLIVLCTLLLIRGASESAKVNAVMVLIKLGVLILFIVVGLQGWDSDNLSDFAPFGLDGVTSAAGIIFFSYIGLDAVSTAGEEVKNPRRTMPLAIIIALVTVTTVYIAVAVVAVAAQPMAEFEGQEAGLAAILEDVTGATWPSTVLAAGAVISIFSVTLVEHLRPDADPVRDGPRRHDPVALPPREPAHADAGAGDDHRRRASSRCWPAVLPIDFLAEMTSIGTLVAFLVVSIGVMVLRRTAPDLPRGFKVPGYPVTPMLSIAGCIWIIQDLRAVTIWVFFGWAAVALLWYFTYGIRALGAGAGSNDARRRLRAGRARARRCSTWRRCSRARRGEDLLVARSSRRRGRPGRRAWTPSTRPSSADARRPRSTRRARGCPASRRAYVVHHARSTPAGLLEVAEQHDASADRARARRRAGALGHVALGSVSRPARALLADPGRARAARVPLPRPTARCGA